MRFRRFRSLPILAALLAGATVPLLGAESQDERASYAFLRTLDGSAVIAASGQGVGDEAEVNEPLLSGDALRVARGSRAELLLPDHNRVLVEGGSVLLLDRLAFSGDREERVTVLRLDDGELLLEVGEDALGDELPRIDTPSASLYIHEPGLYRIAVDDSSWTEVTTRSGFAELVTERGSSIVRADETALAEGGRWGRVELSAAGSIDQLERWNRELADRASRASRSSRYVEPYLSYAAAPLDEYGTWITIDSVGYWQPHVNNVWRPYWDGRWTWTPSGYTWVSYEPWGWVPYHYGTWSIRAGYGWVWRPGPRYSPAWVYWNWNDGWAGWCPIGYYSTHYDPWYRGGFRLGFYGWAGGGWGIYSDWNFAPLHCFRDRSFRGFVRTGHDWQREHHAPAPPRGLITTDTRDFRPDRLGRPDEMLRQIRMRKMTPHEGSIVDVTDFVARKRELPTDVVSVIAPAPGARGRIADAPVVQVEPGWRAHRDAPRKGGPDSGVTQGRGSEIGSPSLSTFPRRIDPKDGEAPAVRGKDASEVRRVTGQPPATGSSNEGAWRSETRGKGERAPVASDDRQGWKRSVSDPGARGGNEKSGGSPSGPTAPVERVVGSVRRSAPKTEAPTQVEPPRRPAFESDKGSPGTTTRSTGTSRERVPSGSGGSGAESTKSAPVSRNSSSGGSANSGQSAPSYRERSTPPKEHATPPPTGSSGSSSVRSTPPPSRDYGSAKSSGGGGGSRSSAAQRSSGGSQKNSGGSSKSSGSSKSGGSGSGQHSSSGDSKHGVG